MTFENGRKCVRLYGNEKSMHWGFIAEVLSS